MDGFCCGKKRMGGAPTLRIVALHPIIVCLTAAIVLGGKAVTPSLALTDPGDAAIINLIQKAWLPRNFSGFWNAKDPCASKIVNTDNNIYDPADPNVYNYFLLCDKTGHVSGLDFTNQHLVGELIPEIGNLSHVTSLKLGQNNFTGTIPLSWAAIPFLQILQLNGNRLSGVVPAFFGNFKYITTLNLDDQQPPGLFGGTIPSELGNLKALSFLGLSGLNLTGTIPLALQNCTNLRYLFLDNNLLHGEIPAFLQIAYGSFVDNYLQGSVPPQLVNITTLGNEDYPVYDGNCFERTANNWQYIQYQKTAIDCNNFYASVPPPAPPPLSLAPAPAPSPLSSSPLSPPMPARAGAPSGPPNKTTGGTPPDFAAAPAPGGSVGNATEASGGSAAGIVTKSKSSKLPVIIGVVLGVLCLVVALVTILLVCCCKRQRTSGGPRRGIAMSISNTDAYLAVNGLPDEKTPREPQPNPMWAIGSNNKLPYGPTIFPYNELKEATNNFAEDRVLGKGGFGAVYYGLLPSDGTSVAIKVLSAGSSQGEKEFFAELSLISQLSHRNLVRLRGWCNDDDVPAVLVYEFFAGGSLDTHLFPKDSSKPVVSWKERYRIITGVAQALNYMHEEWTEQVVHRDVKSSNILLDSNMNGYLGDFGLALSAAHDVTHFPSTRPAFTFGYAPPEAFCTNRATPKWDVFSFGVVCLEVASGQKAFDPKRSTEDDNNTMSLWYYAWKMYNTGALLELADQKLEGQYPHDEMVKLLSLGLLCISRKAEDRPHMRDAVRILQSPPSTPVPLPMADPMADPTLPDNFDARSFLSSSTGNSSSIMTPSYGQRSPLSASNISGSLNSVVQPSYLLSGR